MGRNMQASYNKMTEYGKKLTSLDFNNVVRIIHEDGSIFVLCNTVLVHQDCYIWIFTEHCGNLIFHENDLYDWTILKHRAAPKKPKNRY